LTPQPIYNLAIIYYIDKSILVENRPLVKFIIMKLHPGLRWPAYFPYPHHWGYRWHHFLVLHSCLCKNTLVYIIKRKLPSSLKIGILFSCGKNYFTHLLHSFVKIILFSSLKNKIHIFAPPCNILYLSPSSNYTKPTFNNNY